MENSSFQVFVYGTLKPGGFYWPHFCEGKVSSATPAKIYGELYDLHVGYPGVFMRGTSWVHGYILSFRELKDFKQLDVLEGYEPNRPLEANEYVRLQVECFNTEGKALGKVWAYQMTEATYKEFSGTRIDAGVWPVDGLTP
jgi:gamma-glutamylcyclotransferase (GGCT)/AIG2-like uncharacterized protein YtfP